MLFLSHEEKWPLNMAWCKDMKTALTQICKFLWENIPSEALRSSDMFSHKSLGKMGSYFPSKWHSRTLRELRTTCLPWTHSWSHSNCFWVSWHESSKYDQDIEILLFSKAFPVCVSGVNNDLQDTGRAVLKFSNSSFFLDSEVLKLFEVAVGIIGNWYIQECKLKWAGFLLQLGGLME